MIRLYVIWYYSVGLGAEEQAVQTSNFQPLEVVSRGSDSSSMAIV